MNRLDKIKDIRKKLKEGKASIGSWMQIPHSSIAEIMGDAGFDWIAVDLEHGSISDHQLPDIFRALELGGTLPLARVVEGNTKECKRALDAGAGGIIIPMVESSAQLADIVAACQWPPAGRRGVGFSRANLFGKYFDDYIHEAQAPFIVAMIENIKAVKELDSILSVKGLDAILIGPYDLSASMGITGNFSANDFIEAMNSITNKARSLNIPSGIHVVKPDENDLRQKVLAGFQFIAYSIDAVFLSNAVKFPKI
jgi:2-dehydro-3-deoxyglucarate aldolase